MRRTDQGLGADVLRHEVRMLPEPIAGAFDLHDDRMVQQAVQQCGCDDGIAEHLAPFGEATVGRQDHRAAFVTGVDQLEEQVAPAGDHRQVPDLVDNQQREATVEADLLA